MVSVADRFTFSVVDFVRPCARELARVLDGYRPGGDPGAHIKSVSHRCHPILVVFEWELTEETINSPLGCLQGGWCLTAVGAPQSPVDRTPVKNPLGHPPQYSLVFGGVEGKGRVTSCLSLSPLSLASLSLSLMPPNCDGQLLVLDGGWRVFLTLRSGQRGRQVHLLSGGCCAMAKLYRGEGSKIYFRS